MRWSMLRSCRCHWSWTWEWARTGWRRSSNQLIPSRMRLECRPVRPNHESNEVDAANPCRVCQSSHDREMDGVGNKHQADAEEDSEHSWLVRIGALPQGNGSREAYRS